MFLRYNLGVQSQITTYTITNRPIAYDMPFYVISFGHFLCDSSYYIERRNMPEYLMIYTKGGKGTLTYASKNIFTDPGQYNRDRLP